MPFPDFDPMADGFKLPEIDPSKWRFPILADIWDTAFPGNVAQDMPLNQPMTPEELGPQIDRLLAAGVPMSEIESQVMILSNRGAPAPAVQEAINVLEQSYKGLGQIDDTEAQVDESIGMQQGYLDDYENYLNEVAGRYKAIQDNPNLVRSDVELGKVLGHMQNQIAAGVDQDMREIGSSVAGSGLRSSGSASDYAFKIRQGGNTAKAGVFGDMLGEAQRRYDSSQTQLGQVGQARSDIEAGRTPYSLSFLDARLGSSPQFNPYGAPGYALGISDYDRGNKTEGLGAFTGGIKNATDSAFDLVSEVFG